MLVLYVALRLFKGILPNAYQWQEKYKNGNHLTRL
jgi:hypothetical protein